jgi:large subunit ribosomal protein L8e
LTIPLQGVVKDIVHESGRGAPIAKVQFQNAYRFKRDNEAIVAVEGLYSGQFIYAGKKGQSSPVITPHHFTTYAWSDAGGLCLATTELRVRFGRGCVAATLTVGNILPLSQIPEGTVVCNIEARPGDRGAFARTSGTSAVVVTHDEDRGITKIRLPSGAKKTVSNRARAQVM